jgi:peptidyl-Asp metalloendopeptidase
MRKLALTLTVALIVGGCSSESEVAQDTAQTSANSKDITSLAQAPRLPTGRKSSFAAMSDHGTLLAYDRSQQPLHRGAQTYHAVQLSEAHALNAAAPGKSIELPTPSGGMVHIDYLRHEEGLDGNWSWVGKTADGLDAVITFGENAVFGRIAQRDTEALRLTMSAGRSWLVESDPSKMLDGNLGRDSDASDVLIPPSVAAAVTAKKRSTAAMMAAGDEAASAANTVDVVLGFTNGLVTKYGSVANANTRLSNLVAITNQGYVNSLVTPRIRLVRTVQVSYTDTNSNDTALEAVTGFTCTTTGCTAQTVPTELVPLRTARDTYGGDLVSLVRPFQAPQHQGCGIAWLLGGGGFTIDNTDAPFGYSVVSDGTDVDEGDGRTYFCREETLAHELGHNMGQQHNIEDAGSPPDSGTHTYSYGYRETTTTGFYTVMAYRLANSSQFSINYFGNPSVNYADTGRPTGTAAADNARSLNISIPLVALFRATVVPFGGRARNDFNGDGKSDIVMWNPTISYLAYWIMNGSVYTGASGFGVAPGFTASTTGFLSAIPQTSLLARNTTTQTLYSYIWNGTTHAQGTIGGTPAGWDLIGTGDIDGDGKGDLLWRNPTTGNFAYWLMNGAVYLGGQTYSPPVTYVIAGVADFNADGRVDLLWNDPGTRNASIWLSTGTGFNVQQIGQYGTDWNMVGTADVTGDGKADIILRDNAKLYLAYWRMDGAVYQGSSAFGLASNRELFTTGDFDGDGIEDLVLSRASDRNLFLWRSNGTVFTEGVIGQYGAEWTVLK